jgi:hypothetical protein
MDQGRENQRPKWKLIREVAAAVWNQVGHLSMHLTPAICGMVAFLRDAGRIGTIARKEYQMQDVSAQPTQTSRFDVGQHHYSPVIMLPQHHFVGLLQDAP